jgi:fumarate hydratase subunit beta
MAEHNIKTPLTDEDIEKLRIGDSVKLTGVVYTARDAAHKRMVEGLDKGQPLPFDIKGCLVYYVGPSPTKPGNVIGSAGPTTAYRMDPFAPRLMEIGMKGMIAKGKRNDAVKEAMAKHKVVYLGATGGAAALIAKCIKKCDIIAYEDLGPEAVRRLEVEDMPLIVVTDCHGGDLYIEGRKQYEVK